MRSISLYVFFEGSCQYDGPVLRSSQQLLNYVRVAIVVLTLYPILQNNKSYCYPKVRAPCLSRPTVLSRYQQA